MTVYTNPVLDRDIPDPNVIRASELVVRLCDAGTGRAADHHTQVARSRDLVTWEYLGEALPLPSHGVEPSTFHRGVT